MNKSFIKKRAVAALKYHELSKHHADRYADGPNGLDFTNQPMPFSRYAGAPNVALPLLESAPASMLDELYERGADGSELVAAEPVTVENVAALLELSLGLAAWKSFNSSTWALRVNPSSGNLHPTEAHLLLPSLNSPSLKSKDASERQSLPGGLYHYGPYTHSLERRALFSPKAASALEELFGNAGFILGLTSIYWREAWKYGVRAFRYCSLDIGHAIGSISFAAALLGWKVSYLREIPDIETARALGLDRTEWHANEKEEPELLLYISPDGTSPEAPNTDAGPQKMIAQLIGMVAECELTGAPERLSAEHVLWSGIEEVSNATEKIRDGNPKRVDSRPGTSKAAVPRPYLEYPEYHQTGTPEVQRNAAENIRLRRSAQAYDPYIGTDSGTLYAMLDRTVPREQNVPFDTLGTPPEINLLLFIHRVGGLKRGLYMLVRNPDDLDDLKSSMPTGLWTLPDGAPEALGLYLIKEGDYRAVAARLSCRQEIAGDSAFSLGMLGRVKERATVEPHAYRRLFWEAGLIGQVLYLEATSIGMSGTGIGCFHDDTVTEVAGMTSDTFCSIYHFTVGRAVEDTRIQTLAPYHHLQVK
ncbi:MAG: nitroreductase family protein [Proteobacteria bacterium]|nr:nitroreductase family protein [Pseudomonadota bacterium]